MSYRPLAGLLAVAALALAACGAEGATSPPGLQVVATTSIVADISRGIVGDEGTVEVLVEPGQDAHAFAPSAQQTRSLRQADLVVAIGFDLEEQLQDSLRAAESDGVEVLRVAEIVDPLDEDPHVWHDPVRMADAAQHIAERLAEVAGDDADWAGRGEQVAAEILVAHEQARTVLAAVPERCRQLITNHDSLSYFAARYGFEVVGSVIPGTSSQAEPSAAELAELADTLRATGVPAVFAEVESSSRLAETLAAEVGSDVEVVSLHTESLGAPDSGAATYTDMIRTNAQLVAETLAGC
ncbi:MAG: metal ABC transporter substrate-binding protein [Actinobacteria bacterium]|nr:metal ABC transporter substrate-binding protein [Actinomycetota bacterium]